MVEKTIHFKYPDDDGKHTRPWIKDGDERCRDGCQRVLKILSERPWVNGDVIEVPMCSADDENGIDMFVPINEDLLKLMRIRTMDRGVPFQIKSSYKACLEFAHKHEIFKRNKYIFGKGEYIFILNGTDAKELVMADIAGQVVGLAMRDGSLTEEMVLDFLQDELGDKELVERYKEHKIILDELAWYSGTRTV